MKVGVNDKNQLKYVPSKHIKRINLENLSQVQVSKKKLIHRQGNNLSAIISEEMRTSDKIHFCSGNQISSINAILSSEQAIQCITKMNRGHFIVV